MESNAPGDAEGDWYLYLLECRDGRTYAGIARDVEARFEQHASGKGARFTRANPPVRILGATLLSDRSEASKAEHALKKLNRTERLAWASAHPYPSRQG